MSVPFNKPYLTGQELEYIREAAALGHLSGDGSFTKKCQQFFEQRYGFRKCLLTTSCTDALEMCALLLNLKEGDEVIVPSFTFVSTANAFALRGAKLIFADTEDSHPNISVFEIEKLITARTKAIVAVHYGGTACDMDAIMQLAALHNLVVIEDAAMAVDSFYKARALGSIGHLATFSFHETKNVQCGEGGMLVINDERFFKRAEIIREKGTNRSAFFRGEVDKYTWVDVGSSFLLSDLNAAFLLAQLNALDDIQTRRKDVWQRYQALLLQIAAEKNIGLPLLPDYASGNTHLYYTVCDSLAQRTRIIAALRAEKIHAVFHYQSLHVSPFGVHIHDGRALPNTERFSDCLLRLPFFYDLTAKTQQQIAAIIQRAA